MDISNNICKTGEFKDAVFYDAICSCQADNHSQQLIVEYDKEFQTVNLQLYSKIITPNWTQWNTRYELSEAMSEGNYQKIAFWRAKLILEHIWTKIKFTYRIWFKGYVDAENQFMFRNTKAVEDYVFALTVAKEKMVLEQLKDKRQNGNTETSST